MFSIRGNIAEIKTEKYLITAHARERFVCRFSSEKYKYIHLRECKQACGYCDLQKKEIIFQKHRWDSLICCKLHDAEDVRIFENDTEFMEQMYSKYGYGRYKFLVSGYIVFVVVLENGINHLVTCVDGNNSINNSTILARYINRPKFNRKKILEGNLS